MNTQASTTSHQRASSLIILEMSPLKTFAHQTLDACHHYQLLLCMLLHLEARLEAFHAYLGDLISVQVKPSHFTGPSGLRNASVGGQENSCKTFTVCFFFLLTAR